MSASKDKLLRKQQVQAGTDKRSQTLAKEKAQHRKNTITYSVVAVLLVVLFAFVLIYNSTWPSRHTTAVEIDGEKYTVAQLNYYYSSAYMTYCSTYYSYLGSYGLPFDTQASLADQDYDDEQTWREFFLHQAVDNMTQVQMLCTQAEAAGFTMPEDRQQAYEEELESIRTSWEDLNYSNYQQYLNLAFGKGVDDALVEQELYRGYLAGAYYQSVYDGFTYSQDELTSYYEEHADELDRLHYAYYTVTDDSVDAQAMAEAIDGQDEEAFADYLAENVGEDVSPVTQTLPGSSVSVSYSEWLLDPARVPGEATAIETDSATFVVMFLDRDRNDYPTVGFRHILVNAQDSDGDGTFSQEEIDAAAETAQEIYDEWQAGDATEDSFAALADERSEDGGSNTNGGLYEDVYKGQMVEPINDWLFEEGRQAGDTTVVSYDGASYTGTHVVYFTGASDKTYADTQAENALREQDAADWQEEAMADYQAVTSHLGMCGKNH